MYIPYSTGDKVAANESIVEIIKEGWNVPNRIPFASELKIADGEPVTQKILADASGVIKFFILNGDYLDRLKDIKKGHKVTEKVYLS